MLRSRRADEGELLGGTVTTARAQVRADSSGFHEAFCADLPDAEAAFMAISQRPLSGVAFGEKAPTPAWRTRHSPVKELAMSMQTKPSIVSAHGIWADDSCVS